MNSSEFRSIVEPIMNEEFDGLYDQRADEYAQVFKEIKGTPRSYHEEPVLYGFGAAPAMPEGTTVTYRSGGVLYIKRYIYEVYGLAFALTKVLVEDGDHIRIGQIYAQHLAQAMIETKELLGADVLNQSFSSTAPGGDGVSLVNANHPVVGGVSSNVLASPAALSQTSVEQMLIQIRQATDSTGKKIRLTPRKLILSPSNVFQGEVILKSVLRSGAANNDINPIKSMGMLAEGQANLSRLTSNTAWWIQTDVMKGLQLVMRRKLEKSMEGDFDTDSMRYKASERWVYGWTDWRGVFGTPGI
jgi:hypothetical protein